MTQFEIFEIEDSSKWDQLVKGSPAASVFVESWFLGSFAPLKFKRFAVARRGNIELCLLICLDAAGRVITDPLPFTQYQGFFFTRQFYEQTRHSRIEGGLAALEFALHELSVRFSELTFSSHWRADDLRAFSWLNYSEPIKGQFKFDLYYSGIIRLREYSSFEDYLGSIRKTRRQEFTKAASFGLEVKRTEDVQSFIRVYQATFDRQGIEVGEERLHLVARLATNSLITGCGDLFGCYKDGQLASAALFLRDQTSAYYLFGANDPAFRRLPTGTLVVLEGIRSAFASGLEEVDLCGMNSPSRGAFKAGFAPGLKPYQVMRWCRPKD